MADNTRLLHLLILLLLCLYSNFYCFNAVPITRVRSLQHSSHGFRVSQETNTKNALSLMMSRTEPDRMELELNDYPGSGANNRHSQRSQLARGCYDNC